MPSYDPNRPLFSLHIPKCAGTSFGSVMKKWFGRRLYRHYVNEKKGGPPRAHRLRSWLRPTAWKRGVCVHGHFNNQRPGYGVRETYPEADQFITVLRDPLEMHVSHYFWAKRFGDNLYRDGQRHEMTERSSYDLEQYLRETESFLLAHIPFDVTLENYESVLADGYLYMGIAEDLQTSVDVLAKKLGFESAPIERENVSERSEQVSEKSRREFMDRHPLEYAIYRFALERYRG